MTIVIIIVMLIHRNILYPPFLSHSLLSQCYTHHPPLLLSLSSIFFFVNIIVSWSFVVFLFILLSSLLLYFTYGITRGHIVTVQMVAKKTLERMTRILGHFSALLVNYLATTRNQFLNWYVILSQNKWSKNYFCFIRAVIFEASELKIEA